MLRTPLLPLVPASAGTTGELGSGCIPALLGRASPPPWVPACAGTKDEAPSLQPSPVEGEGVWEGCSSRTMCTMSSLAAAILWWVFKPSVLVLHYVVEELDDGVAVGRSGLG